MQRLEEMQTVEELLKCTEEEGYKNVESGCVLVRLSRLCRILQSLHPGGGWSDSHYTASP